MKTLAVVLLAAATGSAQPWIQGLLPRTAKIIETAQVAASQGRSRTIVLWMVSPKRVERKGEPYCGDSIYGDYWQGPARLSLVDPVSRRLVNSIHVRGAEEPSMRIPFYVSDLAYRVSRTDSRHEGTPQILYLRDLTGEGAARQFVLSEYEACGIALTSVLGYNAVDDAVVQYPVQVLQADREPETVRWIWRVLNTTPRAPGRWDFTWDPGHGCDCLIHEEVSFDRAGQRFIERRTVTPQIFTPPAKK